MKSEILLDAFGEISEKYIREAAPGSRRVRPWLGTAITAAAAAVLVIGIAALTIPRLPIHSETAPPAVGEPVAEAPVPAYVGEEPVAEVPDPAQTGEESVGEVPVTPPPAVAPLGPIPDEAVDEGPAGPVENENILWYHALTLTAEAASFDSPETVELGVFRDAVFTQEEIDAVVQRLLDAGWEDMTGTNYDGRVVFFSQPEKDPKSLEEIIAEKQEDPVTVSDADVERARQFIADSGLDTLIYEKTGVELRQEADMTSSILVFYGYYNGMKTNTYVRMSFYENGDLAEAKLYAVVPETKTVPALPLEEALQNAFVLILYGGGDDHDPHTVTAVRLEYVDGLPYYILTLDKMLANGPVEARALAVDLSLIEADEDLTAQWERQLGMP